MRNYLRLRSRVLGRQVLEMGWWRILVLGLLLGLAVLRAGFVAAASPSGAWLIPLAAAGLTLSLHRQRSDLQFLQLTAPQFRRWMLLEYALLSVPAAVLLLGWGRLGPALLTTALTALVAFMPPATARASRQRLPSVFRSSAFEWVAGGRRPWLGLSWLALLAVACSFRSTATGPAVAIVVWLGLLLEVYGPAEPWTWLLPVLRTPGQWLRRRMGWGMLYFGLTVAPLALIMAQSPARVGGTLALLLWCAVVLSMVVMAKYAFYPHATLARTTQAGAMVVGLSILGSNPAYMALLMACFGGLLLKSHRQLAVYCHD
ncbi:hypothetical protein GCM10027346_04810 [Hymenobacter seoulensis]